MGASVGRDITRGLALLNANSDLPAVERLFRRLARNNPREADAHHLLGVALLKQHRPVEAVKHLEQAVAVDPAPMPYWQNLGRAYQQAGRDPDALPAFEAATERALDSAECWQDWGTSLLANERLDEAERALKHAILLDPQSPLAQFNLGCVYLTWGEVREAAKRFARALERRPEFEKAHANLIFCRDLLPETTPQTALAERRAYQTRHCAKLPRMELLNDRDPGRKLRVGYIGGDFRDHSAAYSFGPIIEAHDPERVEVYVYADGHYDDAHTKRMRAAATVWRPIVGMEEFHVAGQIQMDRIDVLVELSGFTHLHHLIAAAHKPAPVIVTAWGYLTGTGLDAVDAIFADDVTLPPEHEAYYRERAVRLPHALAFSEPPIDVAIRPRPDDAPPVFGYLGRIAKLSEATVSLWAEILKAMPEARLLLKDRGFHFERAQARIRREFAAHGVDPARIEIRGKSGRETHLDAYNDVDVALDPIPQGGGMTTLEALWMGTPTVTMLGDRIPGRMSASHLARLGTGGAVTSDREGYVHEAVRLAGQARTVSGERLRAGLLGSVIADTGRQARAVEEAYRELFAGWARG